MRTRHVVVSGLITTLLSVAAGTPVLIHASPQCPNVLEQGSGNTATGTVACATVSGGYFNAADGDYATVGGGSHNTVSGLAATVSGGGYNTASGAFAAIGGGGLTVSGDPATANRVTDDYGTVAGGGNNQAGDGATSTLDAPYATVAGGANNTAGGLYSFIGGGEGNKAPAQGASIVGGGNNTASALDATIGGGVANTVSGVRATVGGGLGNQISGDYATIAGGGRSVVANVATGNRVTDNYGTVGGGGNNQAGDNAGLTTDRVYATISGGKSNTASGQNAAVGGGELNRASAFSATTAGGYRNVASGSSATISGGHSNQATHSYSSVGGGQSNVAANTHATVSGGQGNRASGTYATVPGGQSNTALGGYSTAAGRRAKANHTGATVLADSNNFDFASTANNQFNVRATGGTRIVSAINTTTGAATAGVQLPAGGGAWASLSDRNAKANITAVDSVAILEKLQSIPLAMWNYKTQDASVRHIGPMAQDFAAAFGVGDNATTISTVDADGVALAAIQGLYAEGKAKDAQIAELQARLATVEAAQHGSSVVVETAATGLSLSWGIAALGIVSLIVSLIVSSVSLTLLFLRRRDMSV